MVPRLYLWGYAGWVAANLGPKVHYIAQSYPNTAVFKDPKNNKVKHKKYAESFSKITHTRRGFVGSFTGPINKIWPHKICSKKNVRKTSLSFQRLLSLLYALALMPIYPGWGGCVRTMAKLAFHYHRWNVWRTKKREIYKLN